MEEDCIREIGDVWETSESRESKIIANGYAEKVGAAKEKAEAKEEPKKEAKEEIKKPARTSKPKAPAKKSVKK